MKQRTTKIFQAFPQSRSALASRRRLQTTYRIRSMIEQYQAGGKIVLGFIPRLIGQLGQFVPKLQLRAIPLVQLNSIAILLVILLDAMMAFT